MASKVGDVNVAYKGIGAAHYQYKSALFQHVASRLTCSHLKV